MKTYITPALLEKGSIVALTHGVVVGRTDPDAKTMEAGVGSVGFGL